MPRGATLFSGGGGVEALLKDRITFVHAVEFDPAIAAVYAQNIGPHVQVADVRGVDYSLWGALDYLHASPVCKNASQAKTDGEESGTDIETAMAVVRCLEATQPGVFTLENVWGYRTFEAFRRICQALDRGGYMWHFEHLNAADFGVPQTRRRLILRASRGLLPTLPPAVPWVGWYAAIEDLIPTLPESKFADWQLARLPEEIKETTLLNNHFGTPDGTIVNERRAIEPAHMVAPINPMRAFIVDCQDSGVASGLTVSPDREPMYTVSASMEPRRPARAWLVYSENTNAHPDSLPMKAQHEPALTIRSDSIAHGATPRAWLATGRVVKMTPRALARFQSVPDWYVLPEKNSLACTVIGNMVPSLMMRKIVEQML